MDCEDGLSCSLFIECCSWRGGLVFQRLPQRRSCVRDIFNGLTSRSVLFSAHSQRVSTTHSTATTPIYASLPYSRAVFTCPQQATKVTFSSASTTSRCCCCCCCCCRSSKARPLQQSFEANRMLQTNKQSPLSRLLTLPVTCEIVQCYSLNQLYHAGPL
jgi:hypothetical protein